MRLSGVSQVAHAADSAVVHNRMIHSLKVATLGRGLAVRLLTGKSGGFLEAIGGLDPDVVAAASLGHDLGHPPFGHVAEKELDHLVRERLKQLSGFEGNAQSFRVVTKLAVRKRELELRGLNLTRATLNAMLKYPYLREITGKSSKKWGAYHTEEADFKFAREGSVPKRKSVEAEIMDFADDIAYSTHDLEDYYRAGLIPLDRLFGDSRECDRFLEASFTKWKKDEPELKEETYKAAFTAILDAASFLGDNFAEPYTGTRRQRGAIRALASTLIDRFFSGIELCEANQDTDRFVLIKPETKREIRLLKELIWHYVIPNRSLAIQEEGQRRIIKTLFDTFFEGAKGEDGRVRDLIIRKELLAPRYRDQLDELSQLNVGKEEQEQERVRIVVDVIAEMSEFQAVQAYARLTGYAANSFLDFIQR